MSFNLIPKNNILYLRFSAIVRVSVDPSHDGRMNRKGRAGGDCPLVDRSLMELFTWMDKKIKIKKCWNNSPYILWRLLIYLGSPQVQSICGKHLYTVSLKSQEMWTLFKNLNQTSNWIELLYIGQKRTKTFQFVKKGNFFQKCSHLITDYLNTVCHLW